MKPLGSPLICAAFLCAASLLPAQDAPPVNAQAILNNLSAMEKSAKISVTSARQNALNQLSAAASNGPAASDLYQRAYAAVNLQGGANQAAALSDWRANSGDALRSRPMQDMIMLQCRYIMLSLQRAESKKPEDFAAPSLAYVTQLEAVDDELPIPVAPSVPKSFGRPDRNDRASQTQKILLDARKTILNSSIADSEIAKYLGVDNLLPDPKDWELSPGDLSKILDKNVRSAMRTKKDPRLIGTWNIEMQYYANRATNGRLNSLAADYNTVVGPQLMFKQAQDLIVIGQPNKAINQIYSLIQHYPQHPDFADWVAKLKELLAPPATSAPASAEQAAPAAPVTTGTSP